MKSVKSKFIRIFVGVAYIGMIVVNYLANALPINGIDTGAVSDSFSNLFAPAGVTFSIWGIIYFLLFAYTLYQFGLFRSDKSEKTEKLLDKIGVFFIITSLVNIFWIFSWHYLLMWLTVILMLNLLYFLIKIADITNKEKFTKKEKFFILAPFSIYFGWITVATIANITAFLVFTGWNRFGISEVAWTIIILIVGALIGIVRTLKDKNVYYGLVFVWAYSGIFLKHSPSGEFGGQYIGIIVTLLICIFSFLVVNASVLSQKTKN